MRRMLAAGQRAVVTSVTGAECLRMIDGTGRHWRPVSREFFVTGIAHIGTGYMAGALAVGEYTVVTTDAVIDERGVIHRRRYPLLCAMAIATLLGGRNMIRAFARGGYIIVTAGTNADDFVVIHR